MHTSEGLLEYAIGAELGDAELWLRVNKALVDFGSGSWSFEVKGWSRNGTYFTKTSSITGQTGDGTLTDGTPNLTIAWATSGELDKFPRAGDYWLQVKATTGGKDHIWPYVPISILDAAP